MTDWSNINQPSFAVLLCATCLLLLAISVLVEMPDVHGTAESGQSMETRTHGLVGECVEEVLRSGEFEEVVVLYRVLTGSPHSGTVQCICPANPKVLYELDWEGESEFCRRIYRVRHRLFQRELKPIDARR